MTVARYGGSGVPLKSGVHWADTIDSTIHEPRTRDQMGGVAKGGSSSTCSVTPMLLVTANLC